MGADRVRSAYRSPWQNPLAERWIGRRRRELLDHVVVFGERHLVALVRSYLGYNHADRTHLGLDKDTPAGRAIVSKPSPTANVVALPRVGGLHHRYEWRAAACRLPAALAGGRPQGLPWQPRAWPTFWFRARATQESARTFVRAYSSARICKGS